MKSPWFYGWNIAVLAGVGIACSVAVLVPSTIGFLLEPLAAEFHWSRPDIFLGPSFATGTTILVAPFVGGIIDRYGARRVVAVSFLLEALLVASFYVQSGSIATFYARYAGFALLATGTTAVSFAAIISRWFDRRRGLALGVALMGTGLGGIMWSQLAAHLFAAVGWRVAYLYMAGIVGFIALPLMILVMRDRPGDLGLEVDGVQAAGAGKVGARGAAGQAGSTLREAMASGQYWLMAATFFILGYAVQGVQLNVVPILKAHGDSTAFAASIQSLLWGALVVGRLASGYLMDRVFAPRVAQMFLLPPVVGTALLALGAHGPLAGLAAVFVGLCAGAEVDVIAYTTGRYFGLRHYAMIYASYFSMYALGTAFGPVLTARIAEAAGGYPTALWAALAMYVGAGVLFALYPHYPLGWDRAGRAVAGGSTDEVRP